jgi:hypothetical protein
VALGGTSYAAATLPKASVGSKQIKRNAVRSKHVRNHSLLAKDFKPGQLPRGAEGPSGATGEVGPAGPVFGAVRMAGGIDPPATPDGGPVDSFTFTLPRGGPVYVYYSQPHMGRTCSSGGARMGLYVDGQPVAGSSNFVPPDTAPLSVTLVGIATLATGPHTVTPREDCPNGTLLAGTTFQRHSWTALLLGGS